MHINVVSVPVSDQQRAKSFYTDQVGFEVRAEAPFGDGLRWIQLAPPADNTSITLVTWFDAMPAGSLRGLVIDSDDIEADYHRMLAAGVQFSSPPTPMPGGTFAPFTDPDGNTLTLRQAGSE